MSPWGLHGYKSINIPYSAFLFPMQLIKKFSKIIEVLVPLGKSQVNKWSLEDYRKLWERYLIKLYPSCFKSKTNFFDNLIVDRIDVLFKKIR